MKDSKYAFTYVDLLLLITVIIWGSNPTVVKLSLREISPYAFNIARYMIATVACWVLLLWREKDWRIEKGDLVHLVLVGLVGNYINQAFFITGVSKTTAGNSSLIMAVLPIIVAATNAVLGLEKINFKMAVGIAISFIGITLVILGTGNKVALADQYLVGNIIIFFGTITWGAYTILNKKHLQKYSALKVTTYGVTAGLLGMMLTWTGPFLAQDWRNISMEACLGILYSGGLSIALGTVFWNIGINKAGSTKTSLYSNVTPIVSVICGGILLNERLRLLQGLGAVLIFIGLFATGRGKARERESHAYEIEN